MDAWPEVLALFALRVGLPLLVTFLVSGWLVHLDQKWRQAELAHQKSVSSERAAPRCWELRGCNPTTRETCAAYKLRPLPCWLARYQLSGKVPAQCFECVVFKTA